MIYTDPLIGQTIGNYRIDRLLGRGGMAKVYYGWDLRLHRPVAIKMIDERYRDNPAFANRFVREARAVAAWQHPNIVKIFYAGDEAGFPFYVMEYVRGMDLEQVIRQYSSASELMPYQDVLRIGRAVASALDYAHAHGVIHRDVKPSNVIISDDGRVVLTDFGLAMNISQGTLGEVFGSPHFIAPEQARNSSEAVPQSDLYSLGVMLYELLAGSVPFDDPSPAALALKHLTEDPPRPRRFNPGLSPQVEEVLLKALSKSPRQRYQTGEELLDALEGSLRTQPARPVFSSGTPTKPPSAPGTQPSIPGQQGAAAGHSLPTLSRVSVREKVTDYLADQSTARPPAATAMRPPSPAAPPRSSPLNRWTVGCITLLLLASLALILGSGLAASLRSRNPGPTRVSAADPSALPSASPGATGTATLQPSATFTASVSPTASITPTSTPSGTPTSSPTPPPPSPTPVPPTSTPTLAPISGPPAIPRGNYELLLAKLQSESLFLVNLGNLDFFLEPLLLKDEDKTGEVKGEEWGVDLLRTRECVSIWRSSNRPKEQPEGLDCDMVGKRLSRSGNEKFWENTFEVYYNDQQIGICEKGKPLCIVRFTVR